MKETLLALLIWLGQNSDYKDIPPPRHWVEMPAEELRQLSIRIAPGPPALALYRCSAQTLYVQSGMNLEGISELSLLLHELTHHAQCVTGWTRLSPCEREREAYAIQTRFVERYVADATIKQKAAAEFQAAADSECAVLNRL